jgi:hypothetical protein
MVEYLSVTSGYLDENSNSSSPLKLVRKNSSSFSPDDIDILQSCTRYDDYVKVYLYPPVCMIGALLNVLCIVIFSNKKFKQICSKHLMFKYLLYKSVFDAIILFLKVSNI